VDANNLWEGMPPGISTYESGFSLNSLPFYIKFL